METIIKFISDIFQIKIENAFLVVIIFGVMQYVANHLTNKKLNESLEKLKADFQKELKEIDYKNDYYKKILDKRMMAYEELNDWIFTLHKFSSINIRNTNSNNIEKKNYPVVFANMSSLEEIISKIGEFHKEGFWISYSTVGIIHHYIDLLSSAVTDIKKNNNSNNDNNNLQFVALERYINEFQNGALGKHVTNNMFNDLIENIRSNSRLLERTELNRNDYNFYSLAVGMALNEIIKSINNTLIEKYMNDLKELYKIDDFLDFNQ